MKAKSPAVTNLLERGGLPITDLAPLLIGLIPGCDDTSRILAALCKALRRL